MTAPAPPRSGLADLLSLVDVSRARALAAEQPLLADVATLYGERALASRSEPQGTLINEALLVSVVGVIRRGYRAGWAEGMRFAGQQFEALGIAVTDLSLPLGSLDDALVRDFLAGQVAAQREGAGIDELLRRAQLAVVSAVQMGRSEATAAVFALQELDGAHKLWVARFDLNTEPCALCSRLHGSHVPISEDFGVPKHEPAVYGGELGKPPRHPNCRCSLVLYFPDRDDEDATSGPTPLSMRAYGEWMLSSTAQDRSEFLAATVVRVGSYTRMVRGKLQHVDGYFYHVESGKVVSPAQARALGAGDIRTVSVQQAKALRTSGKAPAGKAAGQALARRGRAPAPGQGALDIGGPAQPAVSAAPQPRQAPAPNAQGTARRRVARDSQKQWPQGEYEIKMPSGQNTKVTIHANGSSTATSGDRTEKANAKQTKMFLDFWDGQGSVTQTKGDPAPEEKKESEKLGRDLDDPRPDPVRDADREAEWQGDQKKAPRAKPPEPEDEVAAKTEGVVQKGRASLDPEKKPDAKKPEAKKPELAREPAKKADAPAEADDAEPNSDIKDMSAQELASEIADVEDELRDMRRSGMSTDDDEYREVKQRLSALNAEEDSRTRSDVAERSDESTAAGPDAKQAPQSVKDDPDPEKAATKPAEAATKPEKAPEQPASKDPEPAAQKPAVEKPAPAKKAPAAKKPAAPKSAKPAPLKVSEEDAARKPAAVPKLFKEDAMAGRAMLRRAKTAEKIVPVAGDDGSAVAAAMQLVNSTRHKHHVKVTDDSVRVSLKHLPISNDGSRQYLVHSNGVVFERSIGDDGEEVLTQMPIGNVDRMVGPKFSGESRLSLDDALKNVRKLTDEQLGDYMDEAIVSDRIDDFDAMSSESNRREDQRARTQAQHEARAAAVERLLDEGYAEGEAIEKVTGVSVAKQQRKMMIDALRAEGHTGVNLDELSRKAYKNYLYDMEIAAQDPTAMYYITKEAERKGVDPFSMFYGNEEHRQKYISDELRDFFRDTESPQSFESWQKSYLSKLADTDQLGRGKTGGEATKTDYTPIDVDALPAPGEAKVARAFRGRNADGTEKTEEQVASEQPAVTADPGRVLDIARDRVARELGISPEDAEEAVADALVDMADRDEDPYESPEKLARTAATLRRKAETSAVPTGYKPTGRWQKGFDGFSDEEIEAEKAAADQALTDAVAGGMRSSSPKMFDLRTAAKKFGEEQQRRQESRPPEQDPAPEPEKPVARAPEPVRAPDPAPVPAPVKDSRGYEREPYQDKPNAVNIKIASEGQLTEAKFLFDDGLYGDQENDDLLGAYMSPDGKSLQVHDKKKTLDTLDDFIEGLEDNVKPDSRLASDVKKNDREKIKALKQLRAKVEKAQTGPKQVAPGKETKRAYADAISENTDARRREREAAARAAMSPEERDAGELATFDRTLSEVGADTEVGRKIATLRDEVQARIDARSATPVGKSPEDREDMKAARAASKQGGATLFMFDSDDDLRAMQARNDAVLADGGLKPASAERRHREALAEKLKSQISIREKNAAADAERRERMAMVVAVPQPQRDPELPIEDVRSQLKAIRSQLDEPDTDEGPRLDLAIAEAWAQDQYGTPDGPLRMRGVIWREENRDRYDRQLLAGVAEARLQRLLAEQDRAERAARKDKTEGPPPSVVLEAPAPLPAEHADVVDLDDRGLSEEWGAVQQDMKDMRSSGVKTTDEDYLENKARLNAVFSEMARRAQEGNREYIGGTPSRLEKLQELAKAIQQAAPAERGALETQLVRVFRGEE